MYALFHDVRKPVVAIREVFALVVALLVAEVFYKFHSFSLECVAFLATWTGLSGLIDLGGRLLRQRDMVNDE